MIGRINFPKSRLDRGHLFLATVSGVLLTGAFPGGGVDWLTWFALLPLLAALDGQEKADALRLGLFAGVVHYLSLFYWLVPTMNVYGNLPFFLAVPVLLLLCFYLALFPALFSLFAARCGHCRWRPFFLLPAAWVALEYLRSFLLTGLPWGLLGYSQFERLQLIQIADITGVYGISFLIVFCNVALFRLLECLCIRPMGKQIFRQPGALAPPAAACALVAAALLYGDHRITAIDRLAQQAEPRRITVVQGNIDQSQKWAPAFQAGSTRKYVTLSLTAAEADPDLIVWPETATPFYLFDHPELSERVLSGVRATGAHFLIGSPAYTFSGKQLQYLNSAYLVTPAGKSAGRYDKVHLVPFGEYVPLKRYLPFIGKMVAQVGDFTAGEKGAALPWGKVKLGVQTCYEIIFAPLSRAMVNNGANLLVNLTNDAWFGKTAAPYQHFSMVRFRAVENRRAVVRSANTGISGFIDPVGRVVAETGLYRDAVLTEEVPVMTSISFYTRFGDIFARFCLAAALVVALGSNFKYITGLIRQRGFR